MIKGRIRVARCLLVILKCLVPAAKSTRRLERSWLEGLTGTDRKFFCKLLFCFNGLWERCLFSFLSLIRVFVQRHIPHQAQLFVGSLGQAHRSIGVMSIIGLFIIDLASIISCVSRILIGGSRSHGVLNLLLSSSAWQETSNMKEGLGLSDGNL